MNEIKNEISRRELLKRLSPLGKVKLDSAQCTGCGLCVVECPTEALLISSNEEDDTFQLLFKHGNCVACGQCVEICPEKCLAVERLLDPDQMHNYSVLFKDKIVRCSRCDSPIGPKVMIDKLRNRVEASGHFLTPQSELCPACKAQSQFGQLSV